MAGIREDGELLYKRQHWSTETLSKADSLQRIWDSKKGELKHKIEGEIRMMRFKNPVTGAVQYRAQLHTPNLTIDGGPRGPWKATPEEAVPALKDTMDQVIIKLAEIQGDIDVENASHVMAL
ncbi:uncharacterized protein J4E78_009164 [Alternaria triticimaculans]|uniref:uncharacterized protein n=1 Tax=Alternaria triticimaculans TaxID=297637 RepID=UPI0020C4C5E7|nr:uncharacterized protein J4E78_009164 [Alternaria triticimaculans]KAI4646243.1 hypothetical protein J4E78_009164 [Alternaria triticimaculans]